MNDMDCCVGLNFLELKKVLQVLGLIDKDAEDIDVCDAIQEYGDGPDASADFMYRYGYITGAADSCNCTLGEMIDDIDWKTVKAVKKTKEKRDAKGT